MLAWPHDSPLVPRHGGHPTGDSTWAWLFLGLLVAAFAVYVGGVLLARRSPPRVAAVAVVACAVQLVPLGAPLLLSTDAWAYWAYGRIAAVHDANPYRAEPDEFPNDPAFRFMGTDWRDSTTVYGPAFTLGSEPLARAAGSSADAAAWIYKSLAAVCVLAAAALAARLSRRPALALVFVGWNPLLAVHFAGGGHNDALLALLVVGALAAGAVGQATARRRLLGAEHLREMDSALAVAVARARGACAAPPSRPPRLRDRGRGAPGCVSFARYGTGWLHAFGPLARNANHETSWSLPHRLEQLGVPHGVSIALFAAAFVVAYAWLVREARRGNARLGLATCALLLAAPYLVVWYVVLALPLAAAEDDEPAALLSLVLCAYLLRQTIPL